MRGKLLDIINEFGGLLTTYEYNQYVPKLRDYLIPYIIESKGEALEIDRIFKDEFTRSDVIKATIFYVTRNENVVSISAIDDYLVAINRLFDELLFSKYPNPTLMKYKPFSSLSDEIRELLIKEGVGELKEREVFPSINCEQFNFIIEYLKIIRIQELKLVK